MAARYQLSCAKLFKFSRTLFTKEDGAPYTFYFGDRCQDLEEIINKGGGELADSQDEATFLLSEDVSDKGEHLPLEFIVDCVKKNTFFDVKKYRKHGQEKASTARDQPSTSAAPDEVDSDEEFFSRPSTIQLDRSALGGRSKYTDAEDFKIIRYLINHRRYNDTGGNVVWKLMQAAKVTEHPYQSMKARFKKKILPEIDSYDIPDRWKKLLSGCDTGPVRSRRVSERSASPEIDLTFESLEAWRQSERLKKSATVVREQRTDANNTCSNNFPEGDDDLSTQELDELDQLIVHEINTRSKPNRLGENRPCQSSKQPESGEGVPSESSGTGSRRSTALTRRSLYSSTPGSSSSVGSDSPSVKRAKTLNVLNSSSDEESSLSKDYGPPRLSKFLSSQTVIENEQPEATSGDGSSYEDHHDFRIAKRRVNVLSQLYGLTTEQAIHLLLKHEGDFLGVIMFLEMSS